MSLSEIGRMMNRDHSTIIHLRDKMTHDLTHDENLKEKYNKLKSLIEGNEKNFNPLTPKNKQQKQLPEPKQIDFIHQDKYSYNGEQQRSKYAGI